MRITEQRLAPGAVLFVCLFAAQAALLVLSPILPQVAAEFGVTNATAAQLRSVSGVTAGVAALYLAVRGSRYSLAGLLKSGLLLLAGSSAASAAAPNFPLLLAAQVFVGLGLAMVLSGGLAASEAWANGEDSARILAWALIGQPVAWIVGQPVAGGVAAADWRWAWVAVPLASSLIALMAVAARVESGQDALDCDPVGLWRLPGVKKWVLGELAAFSAWAGTLVYAGAFFIDVYDLGVGSTGFVLGLVAAAYLPGNFLGRRLLRGNAGRVLVGSAGALAVWVALFGAFRPGVIFSVIALALLAFFAGARTIAGAATGLQLAEGRRLAAMSVRTSVLQFGYLFGTAAGGLVLPVWGFTGLGWTFAALFAVAGMMHVGAGRDVRQRSTVQLRRP